MAAAPASADPAPNQLVTCNAAIRNGRAGELQWGHDAVVRQRESFNGRCRDECLNEHEFVTLDEAREIIEEWRLDYTPIARMQRSEA